MCNRNGELIASSLERDGFLDDKPRKIMANILLHHIHKANLEKSPVLMREEMAILIVLEFPKMRKKLLTRLDMPWHHWFNANTNTGFLENANVGIQRSDKKLTGVGKRRSNKVPGTTRKLIELPTNQHGNDDLDDPHPPEFVRNVMEARNLMPTFAEKANIMALMRETFERRRHELEHKDVSPDYTLNRYPHFLSFGGEVIEQEFSLLHPNSTHLFLRTFSLDFVPQILKLARRTPAKFGGIIDYFSDELLNALLILSKMLPCPRRSYSHEARQPLHPDKGDLIHIIPVGSDSSAEAAKKREAARHQVQPHLMVVGHPRALGKMFLVCGNGECMELPRQASPTNAIDLLFKTYFALHLHYPSGWKNVFRFLQVHVYNIPLHNPRESSFEALMMKIRN
ncbi:Pentatricopeptide repeat-containing protein, chloroplastic [Frankliniella fusca]|uniref:Pentatricopeptide repeat-containing protein, chloroplastic n=1 Tax=Frankliniella fusca TaxID=407009 RepID=A0AAE1LG11_9NEOP|nr:Pentatricopeptide repeat-containing protein, chloroplastic [Frankliniella fusca]